MDARSYVQNWQNFTTSLLSLPSKLILRLQRVDDMIHHDLRVDAQSAMAAATAAHGSRMHAARPPPASDTISYEFVVMPGPLAFLTSGYAVSLVAMAVLLNRIQHIVVPPRRSFAYRLIRSRRSVFHALFYTFFPIDLSSTAYRLSLRIPSLYFLFRSLVLFTVVLLQVSNMFPSTHFGWLQAVGQWASQKEMSDVCWSTFGAVCLALVVGALTCGLEGANPSNTSPFNLFGYAMLLHIYSVPVTHANQGSPSRPDRNVLFTLFFPLLQLSMIHTLGVQKHWARYRLVPTSICSLATIIHFNAVLLTKPSSYPLLNYLPCLLETVLLMITLLTLALNALTQLFLEGEIRRPLFGHARSLAPKWDEDFAIVLLRLGTASLEATNVAGLGNEVGPVAVGDSQEAEVGTNGKSKAIPAEDGVVELTSAGVLSVTLARNGKDGKSLGGGFTSEIKTVKVKSSEGDWLIDHAWLRELMRFGLSLFGVVRGFYRLLLWAIWYRWKGIELKRRCAGEGVSTGTPVHFNRVVRAGTPGRADDDDTVYGRFLRGENISDDEDDFVPPRELAVTADSPGHSAHASDDEDEPETEVDDPDGRNGLETAGLYTDLLTTSASSSVSPGPVLLAHMTAASTSPLTRRRYNQLIANPRRQTSPSAGVEQHKTEWSNFVQDRRVYASVSTPGNDLSGTSSLNGRMNCVICTSEPREIICWPCRCLALCNDCRENLASRFPASKHSCPCCRRSVEGYSRIFIP